MPRVVLVSFTPLNAPGGVPRFNRDLKAGLEAVGIECVHYSWSDVEPNMLGSSANATEWDKARVLAAWLKWTKKVTYDDVVIGDGFWADGYWPERTCSHSHGIWSHLLPEEAKAGKPPEFPHHHKAQVNFRKQHLARGGKLTACSDFIAWSMREQWGFESTVINNGIDLEKYQPLPPEDWFARINPIIIHGVNSADPNKGGDHIAYLKEKLDGQANVWLLDEFIKTSGLSKELALANADLLVHPSGHEANSYLVLEALACDVPVVAYDVGLMWRARKESAHIGWVLDRQYRSPEDTLDAVQTVLKIQSERPRPYCSRAWVSQFSLQNFAAQWVNYLKREFGL
jgi:glycosyltransferase involved in cell wall biosynthesis